MKNDTRQCDCRRQWIPYSSGQLQIAMKWKIHVSITVDQIHCMDSLGMGMATRYNLIPTPLLNGWGRREEEKDGDIESRSLQSDIIK